MLGIAENTVENDISEMTYRYVYFTFPDKEKVC